MFAQSRGAGSHLPGDFVLVQETLSLVVRHVRQSRLQDSAEGNEDASRIIGIDPLLDFGQPNRRNGGLICRAFPL